MSELTYIDRPNRTLRIYAIGYLVFLYGPILFLPLFSFNDSIYTAFPLQGFTTQWYVAMFNDGPMWAALGNSVNVGIVSSCVATFFGLFGARAITRYKLPGEKPIVFVIMLPLVIPGIIIGVSLLILLGQVGVTLSLVTVTLGHILISVPFAMATLIPRFEGFDKSMEEASADLGANPWSTFWLITFPMVFPGIVASLLLCFTISFDEFIIAFLLSGNEGTLPLFIYGQLRFPSRLPGVLCMGTVIIAVSFVVVFISQWLKRRGLDESTTGF